MLRRGNKPPDDNSWFLSLIPPPATQTYFRRRDLYDHINAVGLVLSPVDLERSIFERVGAFEVMDVLEQAGGPVDCQLCGYTSLCWCGESGPYLLFDADRLSLIKNYAVNDGDKFTSRPLKRGV